MFDYHHGWGMMLSMFVFWLLVLGSGAWLLSKLFPPMASRPDEDSGLGREARDPALEVVRQRYASGEITQTEYEELLRMLV